ncbi:hypothetical protein PIIN_10873, partial [Serendipita indica DSM 11827]
LRGHSSSVTAVAFSPDGSRIVSGSRDQTIRLWDAKTGEPVGEPYRGHSGSVNAVAISQDGSQLVSGSEDNTVHLWDADIVLPSKHLFQHRVDQDNAMASLPGNLGIISGSTSDMGPFFPEAFGRMPAASTSVNDLSTSGTADLSPSQVIDSLEKVEENAKISEYLKSPESFVEYAVDEDIKVRLITSPDLLFTSLSSARAAGRSYVLRCNKFNGYS